MSRTRIVLFCLPVALAGLGVAVHATVRVRDEEAALATLAETVKAEGRSFVETLQGEHAERQRVTFDRRRELALALAAARRDRLLGVLLAAAAALAAGGMSVFSRIAREIEEDRQLVSAQRREPGPNRS